MRLAIQEDTIYLYYAVFYHYIFMVIPFLHQNVENFNFN